MTGPSHSVRAAARLRPCLASLLALLAGSQSNLTNENVLTISREASAFWASPGVWMDRWSRAARSGPAPTATGVEPARSCSWQISRFRPTPFRGVFARGTFLRTSQNDLCVPPLPFRSRRVGRLQGSWSSARSSSRSSFSHRGSGCRTARKGSIRSSVNPPSCWPRARSSQLKARSPSRRTA